MSTCLRLFVLSRFTLLSFVVAHRTGSSFVVDSLDAILAPRLFRGLRHVFSVFVETSVSLFLS